MLLTFIGPWNEFLWPFLITKQQSKQPLAVSLSNYITTVSSLANNPFGTILAGAPGLKAEVLRNQGYLISNRLHCPHLGGREHPLDRCADGQPDLEAGAMAQAAFHCYRAAMQFGEKLHHDKAESRSLEATREAAVDLSKGLEQFIETHAVAGSTLVTFG